MPTFTARLAVPVSQAALFAWHERPGAFARLNPPWRPVTVRHAEGGIRDGATVELSVPIVGPLTIGWRLQHRDYVAGRQFVDEQVSGPFARWVHRHVMHDDGAGGSVLEDSIDAAFPFGALGAAVGDAMLTRDLTQLFAYRHAITSGDLVRHAASGLAPQRIAITGATGMIGQALDAFLSTGGHSVHRIVRGRPDPRRAAADIVWDPARGTIDSAALEGVDAVIHLAGASVGDRWTPPHRRAILESRVQGTTVLAKALAGLARKPKVFISASAIGVYGVRGDEVLDEQSTRGTGFLADVAAAWESSADPAQAAGIRVVHPRFGLVVAAAGGLLGKLRPIFALGAGGVLGNGRQWMSWVALDDVLGAILHAIATPTLSGPVNVVAPTPVTNTDFTRILAHVMHRPAIAPVPAFAIRLLFGDDQAREFVMASQRVQPKALAASGFVFRHPELDGALRLELGGLA